VSREKIDPAVSRKAYALAVSGLKEAHADEFLDLLDDAYGTLDVESPRRRRERLAAAAAEAAQSRRLAREARAQAKLEEAAALLRAAGVSVELPFEAAEDVA
jgi:cell division septum initiation protein DivIVA